MYVFYNNKGVGDVLLIPIKSIDHAKFSFETFNDVVKIFDKETNEIIGYNLFHASSYFSTLEDGKLKLDNLLLDRLKQVFEENKVETALDIDISPKFLVGHVVDIAPHENADKLRVCQVDVGNEKLQIVCGAPNVDKDQKVVVAKIGAIMPSGLEIKPSNLRGVDSFGMICSQKELGLPNAPKEKGIYVLPPSTPIGEEFTI
ncbi:YtpR family tRNA-binding protein [Gracilibacillus xinjiangensis]|uniref:YtpR family tRNA-binding protein n=1 Tax=Gracilibacillus xinjiangensis TaxID=1193282 RepID=A0ABV8WYE7_9BACI